MTDRQSQVIEHRMRQANAVIGALADHGPRLFYSSQYNITGYFYVDSTMQGWWVDYKTGMKVCSRHAPMLYQDPERGFLQELLTYIRTGKAIDADSMKRFYYHPAAYAQVWEAAKDLELLDRKNVLTA